MHYNFTLTGIASMEAVLASAKEQASLISEEARLNYYINYLKEENTKLSNANIQLQVSMAALDPVVSIINGQNAIISNEEFICINEIQKLKKTSSVEELSYEQTKKLDIYVKTLLSIRQKKDKPKENTEDLSESDLLASIHVV